MEPELKRNMKKSFCHYGRNDKTCWDKTLEEAQAGFTDEKMTGGRYMWSDAARVQSQSSLGNLIAYIRTEAKKEK